MIITTSTLLLVLTTSVFGSPVQNMTPGSEVHNQYQVSSPAFKNYNTQYQNAPFNAPVYNNNQHNKEFNQYSNIQPISHIPQNNEAQLNNHFNDGYQDTKRILQGLANEDNTSNPNTAYEAGSKQAIEEAKNKASDVIDKTGVKPKGKFWWLAAAAVTGIASLFSK